MTKTYKKINEGKEVEETDVKEKISRTIHNLEDVKKQRDYHKAEYEKREEILKAVGEEENGKNS